MAFQLSSFVIAAVVCVLPCSVLAQGGPPTGISVPVIAKSDSYAAEPLVIERVDTVYRYATDGTGSKEITGVIRMQSDAGARQFSVFTIPFAASNERVEITYIRSRKPDGSSVETPISDAQEMPQEVTRQAPFYSDLKEKQIPVRNLRMGDKLEYKVTVVRTHAEAPGEFWGQEGFGAGTVVLAESVELRVPKGKYVKVWSPEHKPVETEAGDEKIYRWTGSQLKPSVVSDEDKKKNNAELATKPEPDREGEFAPIAWTTFKSWEAVGAWYRSLEGDRTLPDAEVKAKVAELTAGKTTDEDKIRALYSYVSTQVRYIGVALGIGRYQPHAAGEVLRNQYGDCKDKHTLLAAMLVAAGFHPSAALIGPGIRMNEEVPSPAAFNHLITKLPHGGEPIWLDTTAEIAPYRLLVPTVRDKRTLVVPETGVATLQRTPSALPFTPFVRFTAKGTLDESGTVKTRMEYVSRGDDELVLRVLLRQFAPGQWDQLAQGISQQIGFSGTTSHAEASRPDVTNDPQTLSYDYKREKLGDWDRYRIVPLFPAVFFPSVDEKDPPTRAIELGEPHVETDLTVLTLPSGWGADLPAAVHQKTAYITFDKTYTIDHDTLTIERRMEVLQRRVPRSDWKTYQKWYDATLKDGENYIQLTRSSASIDGKGPPMEGSNNAEAEQLVTEANEQIRRGEINKAEATLDRAQKINPRQITLWSTYGYLNYERHTWDKAVDSYKREIQMYPDTDWVYGAMSRAQLFQGKVTDAVQTLKWLLNRKPEDDATRLTLASILMAAQDWKEAITFLEPMAAKLPGNSGVQIQLGVAQLKTGRIDDGKATLVPALKLSDDPNLLNSGAYALADTSVEVGLAVESARRAAEKLSVDLGTGRLYDAVHWPTGKQTLQIAVWDTLGWALCQEGHIDEAASYIRAAWLNSQSAEQGLHLGQIEEMQGHREAALNTYQMALSGGNLAKLPNAQGTDPIKAELLRRSDDLKHKGVKQTSADAKSFLQALRVFHVGKLAGGNAMMNFSFILNRGKIVELQQSGTKSKGIPGAEDMIRRINFTGWTPANDSTRLLRSGLLNCHSGVCEFVVNPM